MILSHTIKVAFVASFSWVMVAAQSPSIEHLHGLDETHYHRLDSEKLDQTYHLFVRVPGREGSNSKLPTVYLLDGGTTFPMLAAYQRYLEFSEEIPKAIVVGISYGTDDWKQGNQRSRDFTAKAPDRDHWGGAPVFQQVLATEIVPLIERNYPSEPNARIVFGQSIGGQFALHAAFTSPDLFWGHIASNPALHRNLEFFMQAPEGQARRQRLFVSSGANDDPRFRGPAMTWIAHWSEQTDRPWDLKTVTLAGHTHFSAAPEAYRQGMRWLLTSE